MESELYGPEFIEACIAPDRIINLLLSLCYSGIPLEGPSMMFGDNSSVIKSATIPSSMLKKQTNEWAYHRVLRHLQAKL